MIGCEQDFGGYCGTPTAHSKLKDRGYATMVDKTFTLPSKDEMLQRLLKVDVSSHAQQKFYPLLTKHAGEERVAMGVVLMLQLAIHDYTRGMPAMIVSLLNMRMNDFIDALCPDEEIAAEAKALFE